LVAVAPPLNAAADPVTWLVGQTTLLTAWVDAGVQYLSDRQRLASLVATFDPLADDLGSGSAAVTNGASALVSDRQTVAKEWTAFSQAANAIYNGLIAALGHPEMAANTALPAVPDTEISFFIDSTGLWIEAILIQSPEPLPW
jgi:cytolysin (calcineurin-like family phosphatase)